MAKYSNIYNMDKKYDLFSDCCLASVKSFNDELGKHFICNKCHKECEVIDKDDLNEYKRI